MNHPVAVEAIDDEAVMLADGTRTRLPDIKRLPQDDPIFLAAIRGGVEVDRDGSVFGTLTFYPTCGMTFERYWTRRVNLRDLAGALDPGGLDDALVHEDEIEFLKAATYRPPNPERLSDYFLWSIQRVRTTLEHLHMARLTEE